MRLKEWQLAFEAFLLDATPADSALADSLIGGPTLDVGTGLAIYHNAYTARLLEVLTHDSPAIHYWMGDEEFDLLATAYIRQYPSAHYSLRWLGKGFEAFIREHLVPGQSAPLAELAALEWAFTLAFDSPAGAPLERTAAARSVTSVRAHRMSPPRWPWPRPPGWRSRRSPRPTHGSARCATD